MTCHSEATTIEQLQTYASIVWNPDDIIEVRPLPPAAAWAGFTRWTTAAELHDHTDQYAEHNSNKTNIYAGVLPRTHEGGSCAGDTEYGHVVWADFDHVTPTEAVETAMVKGLPLATMVVASGHGAHLFWRLDKPEHKDTLCPLVKRLAIYLGTDKSVADPARILRLPGFINHKPPLAGAYIADAAPDRVYSFADIEAAIPAQEAPKALPTVANIKPQSDRMSLINRAKSYISKIEGSGEGGRTNTAFKVACALTNDFGLSVAEAHPLLVGWDMMSNSPPISATYGENEYDKILANSTKYKKNSPNRLNEELPMPAWAMNAPVVEAVPEPKAEPKPDAPPDDIYNVPGFVGDVMQYTLDNAPRPHRATAFCGALCLQALLAGRKVRDRRDLRTNLYMTVLGGSGIGKNFPRSVNVRILEQIGMADNIGTSFASGQGIVSTLHNRNKMLYQVDEMDKLLSSLTSRPDKHTREIEKQILQLYSSANITYHGDHRADQKQNISIRQPHMVLFGTATPEVFYGALSEDTLTNGFIARMLIVESVDQAVRPSLAQAAASNEIPQNIIDTAREWANMPCGDGNLSEENPTPRLIEWDSDAMAILDSYGAKIHRESQDVAGPHRAILNRAEEHACRLAMIYACSRSVHKPIIDRAAAEWALLFMGWFVPHIRHAIDNYVAHNQFHAEILKVKRAIKNKANADGWAVQRDIQRQTHIKIKDLLDCLTYMIDMEDVERMEVQTGRGRITWAYRLTN